MWHSYFHIMKTTRDLFYYSYLQKGWQYLPHISWENKLLFTIFGKYYAYPVLLQTSMPFHKISHDIKLAAVNLYDHENLSLEQILECVGFSNYGGRMAMLCSTPMEFVVARALYSLKMFTSVSFDLSTINQIDFWTSCSICLRITDQSLSISQPYIASLPTQASLVSSWRKSQRSEMKTDMLTSSGRTWCDSMNMIW